MKRNFKTTILDRYSRDKKWCIDYHNKGDVAIYNMIFGRLQSLVWIDNVQELGLGLSDDMEKNVPWNKKMLGAYYNGVVEYNSEDIENLNPEIKKGCPTCKYDHINSGQDCKICVSCGELFKNWVKNT